MGKTSGLDLCRTLLAINPRTNVVYLTAHIEYSFDAWIPEPVASSRNRLRRKRSGHSSKTSDIPFPGKRQIQIIDKLVPRPVKDDFKTHTARASCGQIDSPEASITHSK